MKCGSTVRRPAMQLASNAAAIWRSSTSVCVQCSVTVLSNSMRCAARRRAGRTGRMGADGTVVSIVSPSEVFVVEKLSRKLGVPILVGGRGGRGGTVHCTVKAAWFEV
jgi:hypothetical protein